MNTKYDVDQSQRLMRRREAAEYVRTKFGAPCSPATLAKLAVIGGGPRYVRFGRHPLYSEHDLDAWVMSRIQSSYGSTSEY